MKRKSILTKSMSLLMAAVLGLTMAGCSSGQSTEVGGQNPSESGPEAQANSDAEQKDYADSNGMGRYMERTVLEVEHTMDRMQLQILDDGQLVYLNYLSEQKFQSKDGDTWEKVEDEAFSAYVKEHYAVAAAIAGDGTLAMVNMEKKAGQENSERPEYDYLLNIYHTDGTVKNIPVTLPSNECHLNQLTFGDDGRLFVGASICNSIFEVNIEEGTAKKLIDLPDRADVMDCRGNLLMCAGDEKTFFYDLDKGSLTEDKVFNDFIAENYDEGICWFGGGYSAYPFLGEDNSVYVAGPKGLYRHVINGAAMEQVVDGSLSSLGDPAHDIMAVCENENQEFFAVFSDGKVVRFTYDATVSAVPSEKLTVYSLKEDAVVLQAISAYRTVYPDMYINYEIGMDGEGVTREDALKKLNTKLLSSDGPDVLILDGMNIDTYTDKGVLLDIADIVSEVEQSEGLYQNLIAPFYEGDKLYAVPAQFGIPTIGGRKDVLKDVRDFQSLADMIEAERTKNPEGNLLGICSGSGIIKRFLPICAPSWKNDSGQVNEDKIREFLQQTKRIYDAQMNGTPQEYITMYQQRVAEGSYEDSEYFLSMMDYTYESGESSFMFGEMMFFTSYLDVISLPRLEGFEDTVYQKMDGQSSNVYHPTVIAGINSASKSTEQAREFVRIMLGTSVQDVPHSGFPVNKKSLVKQFEYDESQLGDDGGLYYTSVSSKDGKEFHMTIYPASPEDVKALEKWIAGLKTPYLSDTVLEDAVTAEGGKYFEGSQDLDAAVKAVMDSVAIYMAE